MIDKLFAFNQTCYVRRHEDEKPEVHTRIVRNLTQPAATLYGEVTIDGETWVMRHMHSHRWTSIGKPIDPTDPDKDQVVKSMIIDYIEGRL